MKIVNISCLLILLRSASLQGALIFLGGSLVLYKLVLIVI